MKTNKQILGITFAALLGAAGSFAQTAPTTTPPAGTSSGTTTTTATGTKPTTPTTTTPPATTTAPTTTPPAGTSSGTTATTATGTKPTTPTGTTTTTPPTTPPPATPPGGPGRASPHTPNENASDTAKAVQSVLLKFEVKRDQAMAERRALLDKLQAAKTDAERQAIITQLRTETQAQKDEQSAMGKEIRDELKKLRDLRKTGGS